jgi:hypothetical protein
MAQLPQVYLSGYRKTQEIAFYHLMVQLPQVCHKENWAEKRTLHQQKMQIAIYTSGVYHAVT